VLLPPLGFLTVGFVRPCVLVIVLIAFARVFSLATRVSSRSNAILRARVGGSRYRSLGICPVVLA
jgi:hypothetical protein